MRIVDPMIQELEQEAVTTRRVLERLPAGKLSWRPHQKSMSLGQLGLHVAQTPGSVAKLAAASIDTPPTFQQAEATSRDEMLTALDASVAEAKAALNGWSDAQMMETWSMTAGGQTLMAVPRVGLLRAVMLNHWYHHRGQLLVYLRLLGESVPSVYGPTADESPFM
ncbi:MAG: DinB family protein [Longimicrobiales bacterium]